MRTHDLNTVDGILAALDINPAWPIERREEAIKLKCANYNALVEIASALNAESPTSLDRVRGIVSAFWALKHKSADLAAVARHDGGLVEDLRSDLAAKDTSLKTAHAALTRICDVIGAPISGCPDDVVEAVAKQLGDDNDANARAAQAEEALKDINLALADAGAPRAYTLDKGERPIPDADRVRLLGDRVRGEWRERARVEADHSERGKAVSDAHLALDDRKAPRFADGVTLTLAARIRALTR